MNNLQSLTVVIKKIQTNNKGILKIVFETQLHILVVNKKCYVRSMCIYNLHPTNTTSTRTCCSATLVLLSINREECVSKPIY